MIFTIWVNDNSRFNLPPLESQIVSETLMGISIRYNVADAQSFLVYIMNSGLAVINNTGLVVLVPILTFYFLFNWDKRLETWKQALPAASANKIIKCA